MKLLTNIGILLACITVSYAQQASMVWYESFGASGNDIVETVVTDEQNNLYVLGTIEKKSGLNSHGDLFIAKYSNGGILDWKKEIGGSGNDKGVSMILGPNGELLVLASSNSNSGDFTDNKGYEDLYLLQYSGSGQHLFTKHFGGEFIDIPSSLMLTSEGDILICGHSRSTTGALSNNKGQLDYWVIKTDLQGNTIWERTYGGSDEDYAVKMIQLTDGNYMLLGHSTSIDFDIPDNYGDLDVSLMKLATDGDIIWQESFGGTLDDIASDLIQLENGNVLVAGSTFSNNIFVSQNNGNSDGWMLEVDMSGDMIWEKSFGDDGNDFIKSVKEENGVIKALGSSLSESIQDKLNNGAEDIWFFRLDVNRDMAYQSLIGGDSFENASSFVLLSSDELLITGRSNSRNAFGNGNGTDYDGFLAKIRLGELNDLTALDKVSVHPNPSNGIYYLNNLPDNISIRLLNIAGQEIHLTKPFNRVSTYVIDISAENSGVYFLEITSNDQKEITRLIKR